MTKSSRSTNSMQVSFCVPWEVKVDNHIYGQNIDTTGENVCANQASCLSIFEVVIDPKNQI
jgi:hypothetical protein